MVYAALVSRSDFFLTTQNGVLINTVRAFENKHAMVAWAKENNVAEPAPNAAYDLGQTQRIFPITRKELVSYMGRAFVVSADGLVFENDRALENYEDATH